MKINEPLLKELKNEIEPNTLVAATKYVDCSTMIELLNLGINNFGENRVEPFIEKHFVLRNYDIVWHFIGHLQRNKAKSIIKDIDYLHSLDSIDLMKIINSNREVPLKCFLEIKLTDSETKHGILPNEIDEFLEEAKKYPNVNIIGFMTMTESDMSDSEKQNVFDELKRLALKYNFTELSMGMSDDYKEALKSGATFVRLGRILYEGYNKK